MDRHKIAEVKENAEVFAKVMFEERGEVLPMFHIIAADGSSKVIGATFGNASEKDATAQVVGEIAKEDDAVLIVFISEAWMAKIDPDDFDKYDRDGIRTHPERVEALILVFDEKTKTTTVMYEIERDDKGVGTLGKRSVNRTSTGRFAGMLREVH